MAGERARRVQRPKEQRTASRSILRASQQPTHPIPIRSIREMGVPRRAKKGAMIMSYSSTQMMTLMQSITAAQ